MGDNTDVFLVEISKFIESEKDGTSSRAGNTEKISQILLQRKHKVEKVAITLIFFATQQFVCDL